MRTKVLVRMPHLINFRDRYKEQGGSIVISLSCFFLSFFFCSGTDMEIEVITTSRPGAFPSALRNKRDDVQQDLKDATAALVCSLWERMDGQ